MTADELVKGFRSAFSLSQDRKASAKRSFICEEDRSVAVGLPRDLPQSFQAGRTGTVYSRLTRGDTIDCYKANNLLSDLT